jgi:hypothetical protein
MEDTYAVKVITDSKMKAVWDEIQALLLDYDASFCYRITTKMSFMSRILAFQLSISSIYNEFDLTLTLTLFCV